MRVIARAIIREFSAKHPPALVPLNNWWNTTKSAKCENQNELKNYFGSVDNIGNNRFVFNIGGNNYRLVAMIHFKKKTVYIRRILTHAEYDEHNKRGTLNTL